MKRNILLILLFCFNLTIICQTNKLPENSIIKDNMVLQNYIKLLEEQKHALEKNEIKQNYYQEKNELIITHLETKINSKIDKLDSKYNNYLVFGGLLLGVLVFVINYFGRKYFKDKIELLIEKTAEQYAETKTNEVIKNYIENGLIDKLIIEKGEPAIKEIIKNMETEGVNVIDGFRVKGLEVISSMLAKQEKSIINESNITTNEEIINANKDSRVREFFDLAFTRKDPLVQIELYKNVLEIEPDNVEALNNIGVSYNNAYKYNEAIAYFNKCIKLDPNYALPHANLAFSYNLLDDLENALKYANEAIKLDPKLDWSYSVKGNVLTKKGELDEAEKTFNLAIKLNKNSPETYYTRAYFYEEIGKYDESEKDYQKAEKLGFSNKAMLYNNFAVLYRRRKDFAKAINYLEKARKENPNFPNIDGTLALIYADQKDTDNFYKHLIIALDLGCPAWNYINDEGFDDYRKDEKLIRLLNSYRKKFEA